MGGGVGLGEEGWNRKGAEGAKESVVLVRGSRFWDGWVFAFLMGWEWVWGGGDEFG